MSVQKTTNKKPTVWCGRSLSALLFLLLLASLLAGMLANSRSTLTAQARPLQQPLQGPADLIAAVNAVRAANGLSALEANSALMFAAQQQSEYQASQGTFTHTGAGGSSPDGRAISAGYGNGAQVFVSENIAGGPSMSAQQAVEIWQSDGLHLGTMLNVSAVHAGAGMATSGETVYYTLLVGYITGQAAPENTGLVQANTPTFGAPADTPASNEDINTPDPAWEYTSTPNPEGEIFHIVAPGQTMWTIAEMYDVTLADLMQLNNMPLNQMLSPGDRLLVRNVDITPTIQPTDTPGAPTPTRTRRPTRTPMPTMNATQEQATRVARSAKLTEAAETYASQVPGGAQVQAAPRGPRQYFLMGMIALSLVGAGVVLFVGFFKKDH